MNDKIKGIFCPHMVPLDGSGAINEPELRRLVDTLIEAGISGLYPNGSTGEFTRFSFDERQRIVQIVCEQAGRAGRSVPVLAGAYEANIDMTVDTLNRFADLGARAGALIAPYYYPMSQDSIRAYFAEVADRSRLDLMLYNIPQFSNEIAVSTLTALCEHPRIVGTKDSARDLPRFMNTMHKVRPKRPDFCFLIGCEEILLASLLMGGDGGTIATSGVVPEMIMKLYNLFLDGRLEDATRIQYQMLDLIEVMLVGVDFPEGFRAGMTVRGFAMGRGRLHRSAANQVNIERITRTIQCLIAEHGLVAPPAEGCDPSAVDEATVRQIVQRVMSQLGG
jgi:dihydrodipicolinate synthase/N-acetylneuraminate lyase